MSAPALRSKAPSPGVSGADTLAHRDRIALGMACAALSVLAVTTMTMFAKLLSARHSVIEIAFYRNVIAILPFLAAIFLFRQRDILRIREKPRALLGRSIAGTLSLLATFQSFKLMPMGDAQTFMFTSSLFVPLLGILLLGERVGPYRSSALAIGFLGTLIMIRPSGGVYGSAALFALTAAFLQALLATLLRLLGRTERPETVTFYFLLFGLLATALAMPFVGVLPSPGESGFIAGLGISGAIFQFTLAIAFKYAPAALVTIFNYTGIVWASAYGWLIWGDWPDRAVWTGAAVIIASSLFIVWRERRLASQAYASRE